MQSSLTLIVINGGTFLLSLSTKLILTPITHSTLVMPGRVLLGKYSFISSIRKKYDRLRRVVASLLVTNQTRPALVARRVFFCPKFPALPQIPPVLKSFVLRYCQFN